MNNVYYSAGDMLVVLPPKNASSSIKASLGLGDWIPREKAVELNSLYTIGVIRHPLERVVSALYTVLMEATPFSERLRKWRHDSHVRPQAPAFDGIRVDWWLHVERLQWDWEALRQFRDLPALPHRNIGSRINGRPSDWRDACDWSEFMPLYEKDFALCSGWKRP